MRRLTLLAGAGLLAGCSSGHKSETFTFTADLPPDFAYTATVTYVPASGQTCTVPKKDNLKPVFNRNWRERYEPDAEIEIRRVRNGCELVVRSIELEINASYGKESWDIGSSSAFIAVREELSSELKSSFNVKGVSQFWGSCQWLFRTIGPQRYITKLLDCRQANEHEEVLQTRPFALYTLDQLSGQTVRMRLTLAAEERPAWQDTWVKVPNGWKRCMGQSYEDRRAYCNGDYKKISTFRMPDGRVCSIYPTCT